MDTGTTAGGEELMGEPTKLSWPIYRRWSIGHLLQIASATWAIILMGITILAVVAADSYPNVRPVRVLLLAFAWAFFPPVWAWAEFFFIFPKWGNRDASEALKEGRSWRSRSGPPLRSRSPRTAVAITSSQNPSACAARYPRTPARHRRRHRGEESLIVRGRGGGEGSEPQLTRARHRLKLHPA